MTGKLKNLQLHVVSSSKLNLTLLQNEEFPSVSKETEEE